MPYVVSYLAAMTAVPSPSMDFVRPESVPLTEGGVGRAVLTHELPPLAVVQTESPSVTQP